MYNSLLIFPLLRTEPQGRLRECFVLIMQLDLFQCAYSQMVMEMFSPILTFSSKLLVTPLALSLDFTGYFHFLEFIPNNKS
jgi:hypothetical protein